MKTDDLKLFLHLAQSLNYHRTAEECYLSPSTLSRVIQRMEEEVGCLLFVRTNKKVALTPEGVRFESFATESLLRWGDLKLELSKSSQAIQGVLSLFCSVTAAYSVLPELLAKYRENYPQVEIDLEVGNSALGPEKLKTKDLIVAALPLTSPLERLPLASTPLVFVGPRQTLDDWAQGSYDLILAKKGLIQDEVHRLMENKQLQPKRLQEMGGSEAVLALVALGCGVGVVPKLVLDKSPLLEELKILKGSNRLGGLTVSLAQGGGTQSLAAQALWEMAAARVLALKQEGNAFS